MENTLKEMEAGFRALFEDLNDGVFILLKNGEHAFVNQRAAEITGYSVPELLKMSFEDLVHPGQAEKIKKWLSI